MKMHNQYADAYRGYVGRVEKALERLLPAEKESFADGRIPSLLCEAMRYSLMAGGKRIRPVLLLAAADLFSVDPEEAEPMAAALEMIHTYSLIHDDLPGMDDDDLRRGRPTNHKVYGTGQAILAGDGLLNYAYECMLNNALLYPEHLKNHLEAISAIAGRAGVCGMIAGQCLDLESEHADPEPQRLTYIDRHKTADLLTAPLVAAARLGGAGEDTVKILEQFGFAVGTAFQIDDDLLDIEGDAQLLGKKTGVDDEKGKMTWPSMIGVAAAREKSRALWKQAYDLLESFGEKAWFLRELVRALEVRKK